MMLRCICYAKVKMQTHGDNPAQSSTVVEWKRSKHLQTFFICVANGMEPHKRKTKVHQRHIICGSIPFSFFYYPFLFLVLQFCIHFSCAALSALVFRVFGFLAFWLFGFLVFALALCGYATLILRFCRP